MAGNGERDNVSTDDPARLKAKLEARLHPWAFAIIAFAFASMFVSLCRIVTIASYANLYDQPVLFARDKLGGTVSKITGASRRTLSRADEARGPFATRPLSICACGRSEQRARLHDTQGRPLHPGRVCGAVRYWRMHTGNVLVVTLGVAALLVALRIGSQGWRLPVYVPREVPSSAGATALDALRSLSAIGGAGIVAGVLVPGLGGRLFMRLMAVTSGDGAQGKLTEAEEVVGDITFDGTLGFVIFIGIVFPVAAALLYLALRHFLPGPAALSGAIFGLILLGTFGVGDPMSPDNIDFDILEPLWLAVAGVSVLALMFGITFAVLATRFDAAIRPLSASWRHAWTHLPLLLLLLPPFVIITAIYVLLRVLLRGRTTATVDGPGRKPGMVIVCLGAAAAGISTIAAAVSIL